jgi:hypothetical protein
MTHHESNGSIYRQRGPSMKVNVCTFSGYIDIAVAARIMRNHKNHHQW